MSEAFFIPESREMEMPANCYGCRETWELNDLMSCSDGEVRCRPCHREWLDELPYDEDV